MEKDHNKTIVTVLMTLGIILILISLITVTVHHFSQKNAAEQISVVVAEMKSMMPETEYGTTNQSSDPEMPVVEIEGSNFAGMIEVPKYNKLLPVCSEWNKRKVSEYPCRYTGSMYDGSLIIGAVENPGQFDIVKMISGVPVQVTLDGYSAAELKLDSRDEILSAMVVFGFLAYYDQILSIPNAELMEKFQQVLSRESMGEVKKLWSVRKYP